MAQPSSNAQDRVEDAKRARVDHVSDQSPSTSGSKPFGADDVVPQTLASLQRLAPKDSAVDWGKLTELLAQVAKRSHKDWALAEQAGDQLAALVRGPHDKEFARIFHRVLDGGGWKNALSAVEQRKEGQKPWVVLVTGLNGIRKTTSVAQPWFKSLLKEALKDQFDGSEAELPDADNSFFRQLDYIIATVANTEFSHLYNIDEVGEYSSTKAGIFSRYRTVAEIVGALLVKASKRKKINLMAETSGKDIAMFKYINHFFQDDEYHKLALHFEINDIKFAEASVDLRMKREMAAGSSALQNNTDPSGIVAVNAGGPYGASVLKDVKSASDAVWDSVVNGTADIGKGWLQATIRIEGNNIHKWTAKAVVNGLETSKLEEFTPLI